VVVNQVDMRMVGMRIVGRKKTYYDETLLDNQESQADCSTSPRKYSGQAKRMKFSKERQPLGLFSFVSKDTHC
jgi:hypothetical protein